MFMKFFMPKNCALCSRERDLKNSHIMPQSMYKACGKADEPFESALILFDHTRGTAVRTSKQLKQELLCESCEGKFSQLGEDYFARICYQGAASFKLRGELGGLSYSPFVGQDLA
ncbi:hypothetical protein [Albirhodobacter sp. R86504]|uniref:hypothetical protein n=1 Tax=Albirhodobacter sp. R86504 TaxID=3093848 RepID=UPI00366E7D55